MKVNLPSNISRSSSELPVQSTAQSCEGTDNSFSVQIDRILNHENHGRGDDSNSKSEPDGKEEDSGSPEPGNHSPARKTIGHDYRPESVSFQSARVIETNRELNTMELSPVQKTESDHESMDVSIPEEFARESDNHFGIATSPEFRSIPDEDGHRDTPNEGRGKPVLSEESHRTEVSASKGITAIKEEGKTEDALNRIPASPISVRPQVPQNGKPLSATATRTDTISQARNAAGNIEGQIRTQADPTTNPEASSVKISVSELSSMEKNGQLQDSTGKGPDVPKPGDSLNQEKFTGEIQNSNSSTTSKKVFSESGFSNSKSSENLYFTGGDDRNLKIPAVKADRMATVDSKASTVGENGKPAQPAAQKNGSVSSDPSPGKSALSAADTVPDKQVSGMDIFPQRNDFQKASRIAVNDSENIDSDAEAPAGKMAARGESGGSEANSKDSPATRTFQGAVEISQPQAINNPGSSRPSRAETSPQVGTGTYRLVESNGSANIQAAKPVPTAGREFISQIVERIHIIARDGGGTIRIRLQPDEFGHMEIRAETTSRGLVARITAESSTVKSILDSNLNLLQQNLNDQGFKVDRIQVTLQDGFDSQSTSGQSAKSGHSNSGQNGNDSRRNMNQTDISVDDVAADTVDERLQQRNGRFYTVA